MADNLPIQPFDGQIYVDVYRVKWQFNSESNCWIKVGLTGDVPVADESTTGMLTAKFKEILDSIPDRGGHFGIITKPYLSVVPHDHDVIIDDTITHIELVDSATKIKGNYSYVPAAYSGKVVYFTSGRSKGNIYLIYNNDTTTISFIGQPTVAVGDKFEVIEAYALNKNGYILGDITLYSDSLKMTCVDGEGNELDSSCNINTICVDPAQTAPPGINFEFSDDFLDTFCVEVPGCVGPKGLRGPKGEKGDDGTGDGPVGETGDKGNNAATAHTFTGIKIIDVDDIYDTAVVDLDLDGDNNKLSVTKAKVKVPDDTTPATQVIANPLDRDIEFTNDEFGYEIIKPANDPLDEADVNIIYYPMDIDASSGVQSSSLSMMKLSDYINKIIEKYTDKITQIDTKYNKQMKEYIESKDSSARTLLAGLAKELADCEFQLPIEMCLGIEPNQCHPNLNGSEPLGGTEGQSESPGIAIDSVTVVGTTQTPGRVNLYPLEVAIAYTDVTRNGNTTLPSGRYSFTYSSGAILSTWRPTGLGSSIAPRAPYQLGMWLVGADIDTFGVEAVLTVNGVSSVIKFPSLTVMGNFYMDKASCEAAYQSTAITNKTMDVTIPSGSTGSIKIRCVVPGNITDGSIQFNAIWFQIP